ncbi:class I SAM-dependent methyltransferase [Novipirellula caenicola]|uniref:Methyltransferase domain-containing protein n=1 Tax=Novipirellula caenicola TaxID=1536901 RepID=A0ABP9VSM1_9BACT
MTSRDQTLNQYHELMQINAVSHLLRSARETGLIDQLRKGQHTAEQLCSTLSLSPEPTQLLLDAMTAIGIFEKYEDDYALSQAAQLLCQYDKDLGDRRWQKLTARVVGKGDRAAVSPTEYFDHVAATQWAHTPAAMEAAEMLNIGGEGEVEGPKILDLGCGSAVWSCAMAHRDAKSTITAVDFPGPIAAATTMADSIGLKPRFTAIQADPASAELASENDLPNDFDIALIAQRLFAQHPNEQITLLKRAISAVRPGGRVIVIDLFRGPSKPNLTESTEALKLELETQGGAIKTLKEAESLLVSEGLEKIKFTFIPASRMGLGMMVAFKPE